MDGLPVGIIRVRAVPSAASGYQLPVGFSLETTAYILHLQNVSQVDSKWQNHLLLIQYAMKARGSGSFKVWIASCLLSFLHFEVINAANEVDLTETYPRGYNIQGKVMWPG
jgi:hypothetical protein